MSDTFTHIVGDGVKANPKPAAPHIWVPQRFVGREHVGIRLYDSVTNRTILERAYWNTVTTAGLNGIADQILDSPSLGVPTHMAIGEGTGGTTTLNDELDRNALTSKTRLNAVVTMVGDWAAGDGTGALTEAGTLTASSGGELWTYTTFSVVNKGAADGLSINWTLTIS
jgi:hypothetical protein